MSVISELFAHRRLPKTAFVCGGGGNLGAIQVGMLQALLERGMRPDLIVGCSVGALNGAAIAGDPTADGARRLRELWEKLSGQDIFPGRLNGPWQLVRRGEALFPNDGLRATIEKWLGYRTFEEASVPLHVIATSLRTGHETWFSSGPVISPLLASAALPAVFPPVYIEREPFIDGGVVNNVPVSQALALGAKRIYVLNVGNFSRERPVPNRPLDVLVQAFSIARSHRYRDDLDRAPQSAEVITLPAVDPGPLRYSDFSRSKELIARGHQAATAFLDRATNAASV